jgi:hypothetical protein
MLPKETFTDMLKDLRKFVPFTDAELKAMNIYSKVSQPIIDIRKPFVKLYADA